jgi:hypothetical protein
MILYLKDFKDSSKKLLNLKSTFGNIAGYKNQQMEISSFSIHQQ